MNQFFTQLQQWPPTTTTVIGIGIMIAVVSHALTGSWEFAAAIAGAFKILCPQAGAAADEALAAAEAADAALGKKP